MRSLSTGAAVTLALLAAACNQRSPGSTAASNDELKKGLAAASVNSSALASPPSKYERLRFVSDLEMSRATEKAPRPKKAPQHNRMVPNQSNGPETNVATATEEVVTVATAAPAPAATTTVPLPTEPYIEEPTSRSGPSAGTSPSNGPSSGGEGGGRSIGGIFGAIFGNAVIRGGRGDDDKCDPRTARRGGRGSFAMPSPTGGMRFSHFVYR